MKTIEKTIAQNVVYFNFVDLLLWLFLHRKAIIRNVPNDFERKRADQLMDTFGFNRVLTVEFLVINPKQVGGGGGGEGDSAPSWLYPNNF